MKDRSFSVMSPAMSHFFFDELSKIAASRSLSSGLSFPPLKSGTPPGLAKPNGGKDNFRKFIGSPPVSKVTGPSAPSASNPSSLISSGTTTQVGTPTPPPVM